MGRKRHTTEKKTISLIEEEIISATREVKESILRLVQARAVFERFTGLPVTERACDCLLKAIDEARKDQNLFKSGQ